MRRLECAMALGACTVASVLLSLRLLRPGVFSEDAFVHQYWMWSWRDPQLFTDGLTARLRGSTRYPDGYEALFRLAVHGTSPIAFGEWLGVGLMAVSAWLVFLIVREHTAWRPAAWLAAALFLALVDIHRFHGGFPRAFVHPCVLLTVLLALRDRRVAAALVAGAGALFYPPAGLLAAGVLVVVAVRWDDGRPRVDGRRAGHAALAVGLFLAAVLAPRILDGGAPEVLSAAQARAYPEFGPHGTLHFFAATTLDYLRQNRSGFDLRAAGSILVLAAPALLLARRVNVRLLRGEVLALPVVALGAWAVAQVVLFQLYLPHRYTYPLAAFAAIAVAVLLRPTWVPAASGARAFALLAGPLVVAFAALHLFPLGPREAVSGTAAAVAAAWLVAAAAIAWGVRPSASLGAALTGVALLALLLARPEGFARGSPCPDRAVVRRIASLPKDAVIAGDPGDLTCLPATARRAVVISTQLAPAYETAYFLEGRARMFAMLRGYYGSSLAGLAAVRERYGATVLWVRRDAVRRELAGDGRWHAARLPYGRLVRQLLAAGEPAVLRLPPGCRTWRRGPDALYDMGCIANEADDDDGGA